MQQPRAIGGLTATGEARAPRGRRNAAGFGRRLDAMRVLIGYTPADEALVYRTREIVSAHADAIAEAAYAHLLARPETAAFFEKAAGVPDTGYLATRKKELKSWLARAMQDPLDDELCGYLARVGRAHTKRGGDPNVHVKARYLLATMSFLQTALAGLLAGEIADRALCVATIAAWDKLLMMHLDVFLSVYDSAQATPHWY